MTDYQKVAAELAIMRAEADAGGDWKKCLKGEPMLFMECDRAVAPGHIYSEAGLKEARISGYCEYHFDRMFEPGWTDPITGEAGNTPEEESWNSSSGS